MFLNELPQGALQVSADGKVLVLTDHDQEILIDHFIRKGRITRDDIEDPYYSNQIERLK
jgi:hypothetical protein